MAVKRVGKECLAHAFARLIGHRLVAFCAASVVLTWSTVSPATVTTWNVPGDGSNACSVLNPSCSTIQGAIDAAAKNDTIKVFPGTYSETASVPSPPACPGDTVGLYIEKNGITIQGVNGSGNPITDSTLVQATVNTNSDLCFGPDGIFVAGDDVTIAGIRIGRNTGGQNKTIEIAGDNFTLKNCDINDVQGSVYFNDFTCNDSTATTSHIQTYAIQGNIFEDAVSLDITNGAGLSGVPSGRVVSGNTFKNLATTVGAEDWPSVSFDGSGTGVPWYVCSVGGAAITGNTFRNSAPDGQLIRARGTYDNTQFDWATYWNANTFNKAAVVGASPPAVVETYSYPNSYGTFNHVRRIGAIIQGEVDNGKANDTVLVAPGTYNEGQIVINTPLTVKSVAGSATTIIDGGGDTGPGLTTAGSVLITAPGNVTFDGFTIQNPEGVTGGSYWCPPQNEYVGVYAASSAPGVTYTITNNKILGTNVPDNCDDYGLYTHGGAESLVFQNNELHQHAANPILIEAHPGPTDVSSNTFDRGVYDGAVDAYFNMNYGGTVTTLQKVSNNTINMGNDAGPFDYDHRGTAITFAGSFTGGTSPGGFTNVQISGNTITNLQSNRRGIGTWNNADAPGTAGDIVALIEGNTVTGVSPIGADSRGIDFLGYVSSATVHGNYVADVAAGVQVAAWNDQSPASVSLAGATGGCNRIEGNTTGVLILAGAVTAHGNAIADNATGADNETSPQVQMDFTGNWWGCIAGPGNTGCDTVTGSVNVTPVSTSVPMCVSCTADVDCNNGKKCAGPTNPSETCNTLTNICHMPAVCGLNGADQQCNDAVCVEPGGCTVVPKTGVVQCDDGNACTKDDTCTSGVCGGTAYTCPTQDDCDGTGLCLRAGAVDICATSSDSTPCNIGDTCQAGACIAANSLTLGSVRLRSNTSKRGKNGFARVQALLNDNDTKTTTTPNGTLMTDLPLGTATLDVIDGAGGFHTTIALTNCQVNSRGTNASCHDRSTKTTATFKLKRSRPWGYYSLVYAVNVLRTGLGTADTGAAQPSGPVDVIFHQGPLSPVDRPDSISTCEKSGNSRLNCAS